MSIYMMTVLLSILFFSTVKGEADGYLKLNTDMLVNNETEVGGSGDFPIRTLLFSRELEEKSKNNQNRQAQIIKEKQTIDFSNKTLQIVDKKTMTKNLFQNYKPQVIEHKESRQTKSKFNVYILWLAVGIFSILLGIIIGNRRAIRNQRRKKYV